MVLYFYHGFNGLDGFMSYLGAKHKPEKPLGEDGDLLTEGGAHAFGLGVKSLLL